MEHYSLTAPAGADGAITTAQIKTNHAASSIGFGEADLMLVSVHSGGEFEELYYLTFKRLKIAAIQPATSNLSASQS